MVTRLRVCALLLAVGTGTAPVVLRARPPVQSSRVTFHQVTRVCGVYLMGDYIVVHDEGKTGTSEPCTTFYRVTADRRPEAVVSFHCIARQRAAVTQTTITTMPTPGPVTIPPTVDLIEYQIAGDSEAHGVPRVDAHMAW